MNGRHSTLSKDGTISAAVSECASMPVMCLASYVSPDRWLIGGPSGACRWWSCSRMHEPKRSLQPCTMTQVTDQPTGTNIFVLPRVPLGPTIVCLYLLQVFVTAIIQIDQY